MFDPTIHLLNNLDESSEEDFKVHLSLTQRNARQTITTVTGFPNYFDSKTFSRTIKKKFSCGGSINLEGLHFGGDQRTNIADYLIAAKIVAKENIIIHGY